MNIRIHVIIHIRSTFHKTNNFLVIRFHDFLSTYLSIRFDEMINNNKSAETIFKFKI